MHQRTTPPLTEPPVPTLTGCSECGTTLTGPVCINCAQRADARPVDFYTYDDLATREGWV
jgi:hypothetical protein